MVKAIESFSRENAFLSNFYSSPILHKGILYPTVEHAYQAMKSKDPSEQKRIALMLYPGQAKKEGQTLEIRPDWEDIKLKVMKKFVWEKFTIQSLRIKLLETGNAKLVEGNYWGDAFWGFDTKKGEGKNYLGRILMKTRKRILEEGNV